MKSTSRVVFLRSITQASHKIMSTQQGVVSQVIGPVVDVRFPEGVELPNILDALVVDGDGIKVVLTSR